MWYFIEVYFFSSFFFFFIVTDMHELTSLSWDWLNPCLNENQSLIM